MFPSNPALFV